LNLFAIRRPLCANAQQETALGRWKIKRDQPDLFGAFPSAVFQSPDQVADWEKYCIAYNQFSFAPVGGYFHQYPPP
jgi:hypothetical protein